MTSYVLLLKVDEPVSITVGSLGRLNFRKGYYAYVGSALRNPDSRLIRHLRRFKKKKWHIDYLRENASVVKIYLTNLFECELMETFNEIRGCKMVVPGFGSSDCKRCRAHLAYFSKEPDLANLGVSW